MTAYHPLTNETGGDAQSRIDEAHRIVGMLGMEIIDVMEDKEKCFVQSMVDCNWCTPKQLFWLRDIKDKYL